MKYPITLQLLLIILPFYINGFQYPRTRFTVHCSRSKDTTKQRCQTHHSLYLHTNNLHSSYSPSTERAKQRGNLSFQFNSITPLYMSFISSLSERHGLNLGRGEQHGRTTPTIYGYIQSIIAGNPSSKRRKAARKITSIFLRSSLSGNDNNDNNNNNNNDNDDVDTNSDKNTMTKIYSKLQLLEDENKNLRQNVRELEKECRMLEKKFQSQRVIIEQFEGENYKSTDEKDEEVKVWWEANDDDDDTNENINGKLQVNGTQKQEEEEDECVEYIGDQCPIEPEVSFRDALRDRAYWLVGLLAMQSMSGFILAKNEDLLQAHPVIVYFLTMLVGAGGNAGNQASVRVIRGLALGRLTEKSQQQFLNREFKMAVSLSTVLSLAGFIRAAIFRTPLPETVAVTAALAMIVFSSICLGAVLPLLLKKLGVDPAHSSTTIQVIMDILGVVLTVFVSTIILDSPFGQYLFDRLSLRG